MNQSSDVPTKIAFVLLSYRNSEDPEACLDSINASMSGFEVHAYVVDSFYDEASSGSIEQVTNLRKASYIRVENKGYGYGNNIGIDRARKDFRPDYYVVCNPDTLIERFPQGILQDIAAVVGKPSEEAYIISPDIRNLNGKHQNPLVVSPSESFSKGIYSGYKNNDKLLRTFWFGCNRLKREVFIKRHANDLVAEVYAPHGSFIIFSARAIEMFAPVFDESIFLFGEELLLAWDAACMGVKVYYCPRISIRHKEDGSVSLLSEVNEVAANSNIYVYEKTHGLLPRQDDVSDSSSDFDD